MTLTKLDFDDISRILTNISSPSSPVVGGFITDKLQARFGLHSRLWVQSGFLVLATPFAALTLYLRPPYCFIALALYYFFAETWFWPFADTEDQGSLLATFLSLAAATRIPQPQRVPTCSIRFHHTTNDTRPHYHVLCWLIIIFTNDAFHTMTWPIDHTSCTVYTNPITFRATPASTIDQSNIIPKRASATYQDTKQGSSNLVSALEQCYCEIFGKLTIKILSFSSSF